MLPCSRMEPSYTIGRLAKAAQVPVSTVRYYEQRGLLTPDHRTASSYRIYGPAALQTLRFIRAAQTVGFTLDDIAHLLALRDGTADPCGEVGTILEHRLDQVNKQLRELRRVQRILRASVEWCHKPRAKGRCQVLEDLDIKASKERPSRPRRKTGSKTFNRDDHRPQERILCQYCFRPRHGPAVFDCFRGRRYGDRGSGC